MDGINSSLNIQHRIVTVISGVVNSQSFDKTVLQLIVRADQCVYLAGGTRFRFGGGGGTVGSGRRELDGGGGLVQPSVGKRTFKSPPCGLTGAVVLSCCLAAFRSEGKNAGKRLRSDPIIGLNKGFSAMIGIPPSLNLA